jgi:hypothetical protein
MGDELINGPQGTVRVPADLQPLRADGFLLRIGGDGVVLDVLGDHDDRNTQTVVARLAFTKDGFHCFVDGLLVTRSYT